MILPAQAGSVRLRHKAAEYGQSLLYAAAHKRLCPEIPGNIVFFGEGRAF